MDITIFASVVAKLIPAQLLGPKPNGRNADGLLLVARTTPSENLLGLKRRTSSPHISGLCCNARVETKTSIFAGRTSSASLTALSTSLLIRTTGEYSRNVSFKIMLICTWFKHTLQVGNNDTNQEDSGSFPVRLK